MLYGERPSLGSGFRRRDHEHAQEPGTTSMRPADFAGVTLTVSNSTNSRKSSWTVTVLAAEGGASFVFSPATPGPGQVVQFADTTSRPDIPVMELRGRDDQCTAKNPSHAFAQPGNYAVNLVAANSAGPKQANRTITSLPCPS
ncbi:MAG: hypothetical protein MZU79_06945 [Anaerotruncus sp.]|nr:hypothetical protein [Anaerotruncus sp.]